ncbi:MAG: hypothetical protein ACREL5_03350, partial [Gemmatimonadales bacterium]
VVMREGAGPREVREPEIAAQGDTLLVFDPQLARLTRLAPGGRMLDERRIEVGATGFPIWTSADGSIWIDALYDIGHNTQNALRITPAGRIDTVMWDARFADDQWVDWKLPHAVIRGGPFSAAPQPAIDPAGRVVFGGSRNSRWYVVSGGDTVQRVVLSDHVTAIPAQVRDSAWKAFLARFASMPGVAAGQLDKKQLPTNYPAWVSLDINPRGEWWIGRPGRDGKLAAWDVIVDGKLVGHALAPASPAGAKAFGRDLIALLHEDADGVPWIGVYRVVRAGN